jgi:hypothetical protein
VIDDAELAAVVEGPPHWQPIGPSAAVYARPGAPVTVRVQRIANPAGQERYLVVVVRDGAAAYTTPCPSAREGVLWAERVRG